MSIRRGFVANQTGQIKQAWRWATDDPPSPYPEALTLDPGDVVIEDTETSDDDWQAFQRNLGAYYVIGGVRVPKIPLPITLSPTTIPADGATVATISGIPASTAAQLGTQSVTVADGVLQLTFDLPSDYIVSLSHPLYLPATVTIHAT